MKHYKEFNGEAFFLIKEFPRYIISENGTLFDLKEFRYKTYYENTDGYLMTQLRDEKNKRRIIGRHRLIALAFLDPPDDFKSLDVNHKDGIPGNDTISNLEWATRSRNMIHAYENGLRTDNKKVILVDRSGNRKDFFSMSAAARFLKVTQTTITNRSKNPEKFYGNYKVVVENVNTDKIDWPNAPIEAIDISSGQKFIFSDIEDIIDTYPDKVKMITYRLDNDIISPVGTICFRSALSAKKLPLPTEYTRKYFELKKNGSEPLEVILLTGEKVYFSGTYDLCRFLKVEPSSIQKRLKAGKEIPGVKSVTKMQLSPA